MKFVQVIALIFVVIIISNFLLRIFGATGDGVFWFVNALGFLVAYIIKKRFT